MLGEPIRFLPRVVLLRGLVLGLGATSKLAGKVSRSGWRDMRLLLQAWLEAWPVVRLELLSVAQQAEQQRILLTL